MTEKLKFNKNKTLLASIDTDINMVKIWSIDKNMKKTKHIIEIGI